MKVLLSPDQSIYYMKFGWVSERPRTHLEHINEIIATKIAQLLHLDTIKAELACRNGRKGCLALDFVEQYNATMDESGATLMENELDKQHTILQVTSVESQRENDLNRCFYRMKVKVGEDLKQDKNHYYLIGKIQTLTYTFLSEHCLMRDIYKFEYTYQSKAKRKVHDAIKHPPTFPHFGGYFYALHYHLIIKPSSRLLHRVFVSVLSNPA